jgi:hypothetical protein
MCIWQADKATKEGSKHGTSSQAGECVSVDQLESSVLGLIGQMKGHPTKSRYLVATVFVYHYSNLSYVHLQISTTSEETVQAKVAFERYANSFGIRIQHYHADNGRFSDNLWRQHILNNGQRLTFSGVGAHHQNGRAEKRIRDLQELARTSLIHANSRWPTAIDASLWPYALRYANECINKPPFPGNSKTPLELFSGVDIAPDTKTTIRLGVRRMCWCTNCKTENEFPNGIPGVEQVFLLVIR